MTEVAAHILMSGCCLEEALTIKLLLLTDLLETALN
jgi:hypothetical protein